MTYIEELNRAHVQALNCPLETEAGQLQPLWRLETEDHSQVQETIEHEETVLRRTLEETVRLVVLVLLALQLLKSLQALQLLEMLLALGPVDELLLVMQQCALGLQEWLQQTM